MANTTVVPRRVSQDAGIAPRTALAGVLVMSFVSLLLELALTRLFSVILFYHFAFLAISIALLGLGAGGVFAYLGKAWLAQWDTRVLGARLAALNAVLLVAVLEIDLHVPVDLNLSGRNFLRLTVLYLASALPFFVTGLFFSVLFARETRNITRLYAADLLGGALACLGIVPLLNLVGGPSTILAASAASMVAAAIWFPAPAKTALEWGSQRRVLIGCAALFAVAAAANYSGKLIDIVYAKGVRRDRPWVLFARWNALSRVEVDDQGGAKVIVIDADASTYIMNTDPHDWREDYRKNLMSAAPSVANVLRPRGDYAIIGPGGGVDVLRAVANGSPNVTGIEINPIIVNDIMRGRYGDWAFHLYERPEVHIHVGDGRSWVRNSRDQYDVLQMTLVDTWASTAAGAFALSENNLYTVEAFREYFDHLKPDGIIAITRWEFKQPREALRVVSQEIEVLNNAGVKDIPAHFMVVSEGALDEDGRPVTVLFKKSAFTGDEEAAIRQHLAQYPKLHPLYMPSDMVYDKSPGPLTPAQEEHLVKQNAFYHLIGLGNPRLFAQDYAYNVAPVYDNAPFFFFTVKLKDMLGSLAGSKAMDWRINLGVVVLLMLLVISAAAVLAFLILPLVFARIAHARSAVPLRPAQSSKVNRPSTMPLLYFVAIGLGYILAEIAFIQRFVLFLGHPTYALTVVIFLMLLASGAGSLLSRRWLSDPAGVRKPLLLVVGLLALYVWALPPLLRDLVGLPLVLKLAVAGGVLIPLALAMGMPFPSGLRALAGTADEGAAAVSDNSVEWAWAMNAAASVLGSVLAMVIAIQFGLAITLACGALAYLGALLLFPQARV